MLTFWVILSVCLILLGLSKGAQGLVAGIGAAVVLGILFAVASFAFSDGSGGNPCRVSFPDDGDVAACNDYVEDR